MRFRTISDQKLITFGALCFLALLFLAADPIAAQSSSTPNIVQPGAPGEATRRLKESPRAELPGHVAKDTEFMQGMIMHHAQAVEMVALIKDRTENRSIRLIGERIGISQTDEIEFMERWLADRGESAEMPKQPSGGHSHGGHSHGGHSSSSGHSMPGMLSPAEMEALRRSKGAEFDRLFLTGMIKHHEGALVMVKELFDAPGTAQDAALFKFATDVDNDQRMEIKTMQTLLEIKP